MAPHIDSWSNALGEAPAPASTPPGDHKLLSRAVADWLASRIMSGQVAPGERLPETQVAEQAGVSRSPVREGLRILAQEGLVEIAPRLGAQVAQVSAGDARDLYACRLLLEPQCAHDAVEAMRPTGLEALERRHAAMTAAAEAGDLRGFLMENSAYFRALTAQCPNRLLCELVESTWTKAQRYWSVLARVPGYERGSLERLRPLHEAVRAGDPGAAAAADRRVLERALAEIVATFEPAGA